MRSIGVYQGDMKFRIANGTEIRLGSLQCHKQIMFFQRSRITITIN